MWVLVLLAVWVMSAEAVPTITKRLIEVDDIDRTQVDGGAPDNATVPTSTGGTMSLRKPHGGMFPWTNEYDRTIRPGDIVTKGPRVDVRSFMDGVSGRPTQAQWEASPTTVDTSVVFQAAHDYLPATGGEIFAPGADYFWDNGVVVWKWGVVLSGEPGYSTVIDFRPTADNVAAISFNDGGTSIYGSARTGMRDIWIKSTTTTASGKIGLHLRGITDGYFLRVKVHSMNSDDESSEALRIEGHELTTFDGCHFNGDMGMHIMANPYYSSYSMDHFAFLNTNFSSMPLNQVGATQKAVILADPTVRILRSRFVNNNWNRGIHGFYWSQDNATKAGTSLGLTFQNVYWEQSTEPTGWFFYMNAYIQGVDFINLFGGSEGNGYYMRSVVRPTFLNTLWTRAGAGAVAIDVDNTVSHMTFVNTQWDQLSTYNVTGAGRMVEGDAYGGQGQSLPANAYYSADINTNYGPYSRSGDYSYSSNQAFQLDNGATVDVRLSATGVNSAAKYEVFATKTADRTTIEGGTIISTTNGGVALLDNTANFTTTPTAGKLSLALSAGVTMTITNNLGYAITGGVRMYGVYIP